MPDHDDLVFHGRRRRLRGSGRRAVLPPGDALGANAAVAALDLLRALEAQDGVPRVVMGVIPFDSTRPAHLVVPERVVAEPTPGAVPAEANVAVEPVDDGDYRAAVGAALRAIDAGFVRKVVLARTLELEAEQPIDTAALLDAFASQNPSAYAFHIPLDDRATLVGASPELLAAVEGDRVCSLPLAGTARRVGEPLADATARARLTVSLKDRDEHALLITALAEALGPVTRELQVPTAPEIVETPQLWHLGTPISGVLHGDQTVLGVAYAVHPTPAVGGVPTAAALDLIRILERDDREWYAGLVGWMDSSGDGEWAVTLRCARVDGSTARLYAGAGIVAGSTPDAEHAETAAKFDPALRALSAVSAVRVRVAVDA